MLGLFDGDADPLIAALEDRQMDGGARWAVFSALARLTWESWQNAIMYLGLEDRADKVRTAWAAGRFPLQ